MLRNSLPKIVTGSLPGPKASEIIKKREKVMPKAIKCIYPCVIKRGEGAMFEDVDGNVFLDWVGGVGVLNIGYTNPEFVEAVKKQCRIGWSGFFCCPGSRAENGQHIGLLTGEKIWYDKAYCRPKEFKVGKIKVGRQ